MRRILIVTLIFYGLALMSVQAQIEKPKLEPVPLTEEHKKLLIEGIQLHDQGRFDEAIAKYKQILAQNPNNDVVLYELAFSYYKKGDFQNALDTAKKVLPYKSNTRFQAIELMANLLDDQGKSNEALKLYQYAIKEIEQKPENNRILATLHFNLGVTYLRQKQFTDARSALKKAVEYDPTRPSLHFLLAYTFYSQGYRVPALLAAARFVPLELNSNRTEQAITIFFSIIPKPREPKEKININLGSPKDEGDFVLYEFMLPVITIVKDEKDAKKTNQELLVEALETLVETLDKDKELKNTFIGKNYVPFFVEAQKLGYLKFLAYLILQQSGDEEAEKWLLQREK